MSRTKCQQVILIATLLFAGWHLGSSFYIVAKATLAQYLIQLSWEKSLETGQPVKPWEWADTFPVARLKHKDSSLFVLEGASGRSLAFGPGLHSGLSSLAGDQKHIIIAGHRDTHFAFLEHVVVGDQFELEKQADSSSKTYRVSEIRIVGEDDSSLLAGRFSDQLTLVTCYPFHGLTQNADQRYVVIAHPVSTS